MPTGKKFGGRDKGTKNKRTEEAISIAKRIIDEIVDNHLDNDLKRLTPRERLSFFSDLYEYVQPKLARTEIKGEIEVTGGVQIYLPENSRDADKNKS